MPLFQKERLEQITSLEDLNKTLRVVSIRGWVILLFFATLAVATVIWAASGSLPITATGKCIALYPEGENKLTILGFLPLFAGYQIHPGMIAKATLSTVNASRYGMIEGVVKEVSPYPISSSDPLVAQIPSPPLRNYLMSGSLPTILIVIEPYVDAQTVSGFRWTSRTGPPIQIPSGSVGQVQVTLDTIKPISYVIPFS